MTLETRASRWGVRTTYENFRKETCTPPAGSVDAILDAMGASDAAPPATGALVARVGEPLGLQEHVEIATEDGGRERLDGELPQDLEPGYHRLIHRDGSEIPLILSPGACHLPRGLSAWGWAVQLYSLRSRRSWGIGDLGDLGAFGKWSSDTGSDALMVNPLHAPIPLPAQQTSPYFPSSRCFRNPLYLDIERIPGMSDLPGGDDLAARGRALSDRATIDRNAIYEIKMAALEGIWERGVADAGYERFLKERGDALRDYATYAALAETFGTGTSGWPTGFARPDAPAVAEWRHAHPDRIRFHAWIQWLLERQLEEASAHAGIVHDLAIGVDPDGADAWLWQDVFARDVTVGAPPDEFNLRGQDWGLPPMDPWKLRAAGYTPFIETIRSALSHASGLRIDHVMGLFRLYWIPKGASPDAGSYVAYPYRDLLDIVALESQRAGAYIVGEDLGTVEDIVREEMTARNMLSYKLLWFEDDPPDRYPQLALAAVANHDVPTIAGLWSGRDVELQTEAGLEANEEGMAAQLERLRRWTGLDPDAPVDEVIEETYRLLSAAPSAVIMATLEDVLGVEERPNFPGTTDERPNWSVPLPLTLEEIVIHPLVGRVAELLAETRNKPRS